MWEIVKPKEGEPAIIKLENGRALAITIHYGGDSKSDGMTEDEFMAYLDILAHAKYGLLNSLHEPFDTSYAKGRCECPYCSHVNSLLDKLPPNLERAPG